MVYYVIFSYDAIFFHAYVDSNAFPDSLLYLNISFIVRSSNDFLVYVNVLKLTARNYLISLNVNSLFRRRNY